MTMNKQTTLQEAQQRLWEAISGAIAYRAHARGCEINQTDFCSCGLREAMERLDQTWRSNKVYAAGREAGVAQERERLKDARQVLVLLFEATDAEAVEIHSGDREPGQYITRDSIIAAGTPPTPKGPKQNPITLNTNQEHSVKEWATDDHLWKTSATREINLRTFARVILKDYVE